MKKFGNLKKTIAMLLALLVFLSGFSMLTASAADVLLNLTGQYEYINPSGATMDEAPAGASNGKAAYKVYYDNSDNVIWTKYTEFKSPITKEWGAFGNGLHISYKRVKNLSTNEVTTVTCIYPNMAIDASSDYYTMGDGANSSYWTQFKNNTNIYDAIRKLKALARYKGGDKRNAYYYADAIIEWEYLTGIRNPKTHEITNSAYKNLSSYISAPSLFNEINAAHKYLISMMKKDIFDFTYTSGKKFGFYKTKHDAQDGYVVQLDKDKNGSTYSKTETIDWLTSDVDMDFTVEDMNGNAVSKISVTRSGKRLKISTNQNIADKTYYIRATKNVPATPSTSNVAFNAPKAQSQTVVGPMTFNVNNPEGFLAFTYHTGQGSYQIEKKVRLTDSTTDYEPELDGWYFVVTNKTDNNKETLLVTDREGKTRTISFDADTKLESRELGKLIPSGKEDDFIADTITTYNGKKYGMPLKYTDKTVRDSVTIQEDVNTVKTWINECEIDKGGLRVVKDITLVNNGEPIENEELNTELMKDVDLSGWYFLATDTTNNNKQYVLVTDETGATNVIRDIPVGHEFYITELGRKVESDTEDKYLEHTIDVIEGQKYGIPIGTVNITSSRTVVIAPDSIKRVHWRNNINMPLKVNLKKTTDDGATAEGYYFIVYDKRTFSEANPDDIRDLLVKGFKIVGPTDAEGNISFKLDNNTAKEELVVVELGLKKDTYDKTSLTKQEFISKDYASHFEIPPQYDRVSDSGLGALYSLGHSDARSFKVTTEEINDLSKDIVIENTTSGYIKVIKKDSVTKEPVKGAVYGVFFYRADNGEDDTVTDLDDIEVVTEGNEELSSIENLVCTITTDENGEAVISKKIRTGKYYVQELESPKNYVLDRTKYPVELGVGHKTVETALEVEVEDAPSDVTIIKLEDSTLETNGKNLEGAVIQIFKKSEGKPVDYTSTPVYEYTSTNEPMHLVGKLEVGETYVVHEKSAPKGFCLAPDQEFTVKEKASDNEITLEDKTTKLKFYKKDSSSKNNVSGAELQLLNNDGEIVKIPVDGKMVSSWITTNEPLVLEGFLPEGESFTLTEISTPAGLVTAPPLHFTVSGDGTQVIIMCDDKTRVSVSKQDITNHKELPGAHLLIKDMKGNVVVPEWISTDKPHLIEGVLIAGETYRLIEKIPTDGFASANDVVFKVLDTGKIQSVIMEDDLIKLNILKLDEVTKKHLKGATLELKDENNNLIETIITTDKAYRVKSKLIANHIYQLSEKTPPVGYGKAKPIRFKVLDTNRVQKVVMFDKKTSTPVTGGEPYNPLWITGIILILSGVFGLLFAKGLNKR